MIDQIKTRFPLAYRMMINEAETRPDWKMPQYLIDNVKPGSDLAHLAWEWMDEIELDREGQCAGAEALATTDWDYRQL